MKKLICTLLLASLFWVAACGGSNGESEDGETPYNPAEEQPAPLPQQDPPPEGSGGILLPEDDTHDPPRHDAIHHVIRLGFIGSESESFISMIEGAVRNILYSRWLQSTAFDVNRNILGVGADISGLNTVVASFGDFIAAGAEGFYLVTLLEFDNVEEQFIGLFMRPGLISNHGLAGVLVHNLQDLGAVDNVELLTRDDTRIRAMGVTAINGGLIATFPRPLPPVIQSVSISPEGEVFVGDNIFAVADVRLADGSPGYFIIHWYDEAGERVGDGYRLEVPGGYPGEFRFYVTVRSFVTQAGNRRFSMPVQGEVSVYISDAVAFPHIMALGISAVGVAGDTIGNVTPWGLTLDAYAGVQLININAHAYSPDGGVLLFQWYAREVRGDSPPPANLVLTPENMQGFVPLNEMIESTLSIETNLSPEPPIFVSTNIPGVFEYIARVTNTDAELERRPARYGWTDVARITFLGYTPPPATDPFDIFFRADRIVLENVTEGIPPEDAGCQAERLAEFFQYIINIPGFEINHIHVDGRFNNVAGREEDIHGYTLARAHTVRDRLTELFTDLGIHVPYIHTTSNMDQEGDTAGLRRRAVITVSLRPV